MSLAADDQEIEALLDDLLAGKPVPSGTEDEPSVCAKLRELVDRHDETEATLRRSRRALEHVTTILMRIAALDLDDLPEPLLTGDDVIDAAQLGVAMMAEELAASQRSLRRAADEAREANQSKSAFLASMSHELRTPLNAIIGYAELATEDLACGEADAAQADLQRIQRAAHHLLGLISDVLDLAKIEAGRMPLTLQPVDVGPLVREVAEILRHLAEFNGNQLQFDLSETLLVWADPVRLRQVLFNLVGNAAKYTHNGRIEVHAVRDANDSGFIEVRDTGIGISREQLRQLFQPFVRVDESVATPGTGLGLVITERLCRMMGGEIAVSSEVGVGSTFRIRLPTRPPADVS